VIYPVRFTLEAQRQLDELETHIARAGSPAVAARYVDSIVDYCENLQTFPHRGTRRDDLRLGLRTLGFRRRVTILFEVTDDTVNIVGVYYGGQDYEAALQDDGEE
jgi:toxin ParE1/3/4